MPKFAALRVLIAVLVAAAGLLAGLATASPSGAASTAVQVRNVLQGATSNVGPATPVFAVVREQGSQTVVRGRANRAEVAALTARLRAIPGVVAAGPDGIVHAATDDPSYASQWALGAVHYESVWPTTDGTGITVAVLDTGVRATHEDLTGNVDAGADCVDATCSAGSGGSDPFGHGTHVSGIIAAHANNHLGIAGAAPGAHILPVKVLDATGSGTTAGLYAGIVWATDHGADIISMSLTSDTDDGVASAVNYALAHNVVVIAAAGNNALSGNAMQYPATDPGVLSVGSIADKVGSGPYTRSSFSNTSSHVGVVAPGSAIISTYNASNSSYTTLSGTSMATPYAAAAAALVKAAHPGLTPAAVVTALESTATALSDSGGIGSATGFGIVNPAAAIASVGVTATTTTSTTSTSTSTSTTTTTSSTTSTTSTSTTSVSPTVPTTTTTTTVPKPPPGPKAEQGYRVAYRDGYVRGLGVATYGDRLRRSATPIVALAATPSGRGYWLTGSDGAVFGFGDARVRGSLAGHRLNAPVVAMAATTSGGGYWLLGADGGIFGYGDARFYGSTGSLRLKSPIVDIAPTPSGHGYWLVAADGGIFGYGDARFYGSTAKLHLARPIRSMAATPDGRGYWLIAADGGVFGYGNARYYGSLPSRHVRKTVARLRGTSTGKGYWILATDGSVYAFGDARSHGSTIRNNAVDIATS